jgi:hypothetical protein
MRRPKQEAGSGSRKLEAKLRYRLSPCRIIST